MTEEYSHSPLSQHALSVLSKLFPPNPHIPKPNSVISSPARMHTNTERPKNFFKGNYGGISEPAGDIETEDRREHVSSIIVNNVNQTYNHMISGLDSIQDSDYHLDQTHEVEDFDLHTSELEEGQVLDILSDLTFSDDSKHSTYVIYNQASHSFSLVSQTNLSTTASTMIQATQNSKLQPLVSKLKIEKSSPIHDPSETETSEMSRLKHSKRRQPSLISARFSHHSTRKYCRFCDSEVITSVSIQLKSMNM